MSDAPGPDWERWVETAAAEVDALLAALPADIRARLAELPVTFEPRPNDEMVRGGIRRDGTLGLFVGVPYQQAVAVSQRLPPQVILFLANLRRYARGEEGEFRRQVRKTLLHEIGHYLGLDEAELERRHLR
jgi:predicted Zn-dependent protease with MMP-like domain